MLSIFQSVSEFLQTAEEIHPIPSHSLLFDKWLDEIRELWELTIDNPSVKEQQAFDTIMLFRKDVHQAASLQCVKSHTADWEWLITATQSEQRTEEWYREKENLLTASEIASIWSGPLTRARLIKSKLNGGLPTFTQRLANYKAYTNALDWGVRYEPVVKFVLEKKYGLRVQELGRIRHRKYEHLAASPDGLILGSEYNGRLLEIKCPPSRKITDEIPYEYWAQMQIQMEVCSIDLCEYVEAKIIEVEDDLAEGFITLEKHKETGELQYAYHTKKEEYVPKEEYSVEETYGWKLDHLRQVTQKRDQAWFASIQKDIEAFWNDVKSAREGTWIPPPPRVKKQKEVKCAIVDEKE